MLAGLAPPLVPLVLAPLAVTFRWKLSPSNKHLPWPLSWALPGLPTRAQSPRQGPPPAALGQGCFHISPLILTMTL